MNDLLKLDVESLVGYSIYTINAKLMDIRYFGGLGLLTCLFRWTKKLRM